MYGMIDIGSNTIRLSVYKKTGTGISLLFHKKSTAGLAGYVDEQGALSEEGIERATSVLRAFSKVLHNVEVKEVYAIATASLRNITNTEQVAARLSEASGFPIDLLTGEEEAIFDFVGASRLMQLNEGMLIDIGGGSTELVRYRAGKILSAHSLPIGSLNLYTQHVSDILPTAIELRHIKTRIKAELESLPPIEDQPILCGVGGSIRSACKLMNSFYALPADNRNIELAPLRKLLKKFANERELAVHRLIRGAPARIHTIIPGMTILNVIAKKYGGESIAVSEYGVREGYLYTKLFTGVTRNEGKPS